MVSAVNGIPWWYFHRLDSPIGERHVESVDPGAAIWRGIGPERAIGCVVYPSAEIVEPGVIQHLSDHKMILGEPDGERSERVIALAAPVHGRRHQGPRAAQSAQRDLDEALGQPGLQPLSALTHATLDVLATEPGTRSIARRMMLEGQAVGEALGARFAIDVDKRMDGAAAVGAHAPRCCRTSNWGDPWKPARWSAPCRNSQR